MPPRDKYTPKEVCRLLDDMPSSTLRHYSQTYSAYLSQYAQAGQRRRYTERDFQILAMVQQLSLQGKKIDEIRRRLDEVVIVEPEEPEPPQLTAGSSPALPALLRQMDDLEKAIKRAEENRSRELDELRRQQAETQRQLDELRQQLDTPWWRRLFGGRKQ